jgi:hypothetical protein
MNVPCPPASVSNALSRRHRRLAIAAGDAPALHLVAARVDTFEPRRRWSRVPGRLTISPHATVQMPIGVSPAWTL